MYVTYEDLYGNKLGLWKSNQFHLGKLILKINSFQVYYQYLKKPKYFHTSFNEHNYYFDRAFAVTNEQENYKYFDNLG